MAKKIKLSRKQMKQPDEFITWSEQAWDWGEENIWLVMGGLAGVVLLLLAYQGIRYWMRSSSDAPRSELADAMEIMYKPVLPNDQTFIPGVDQGYKSDKEKYDAAAGSFSKIVTAHQGTPEAQIAELFLGKSYERSDDLDNAVDAYQKFLGTKLAKQSPEMTDAAKLGIGRCAYRKGNFDQALGLFNEIADSGSPYKPEALSYAARASFAKGDVDKSKELLDKLKKDFPDSYQATSADYMTKYWEEEKEQKKQEAAMEGQGSETMAGDTAQSAVESAGSTASSP